MIDAVKWFDFIESQEVLRFVAYIESTQMASENWIKKQIRRYADGSGGLYGMYNEENVLIGQSGLIVHEIDGREELEVEFHVIPEFWNEGYAYEAAKVWKDYAFQNRFNNSLVSMMHIKNVASQKVATKNGMKIEKEAFYKDLPVTIYRITYAEWLQEFNPEVIT